MAYFLGVDIGNTKSHALVANGHGRAVGFGQGGPGSWEAVGWQRAQVVLQDIVGQALAQAGIEPAAVQGAGFGFAGYDWPEDRPGHAAMVASLGLANATCAYDNDTLVGLVAGAEHGWGVVVVAGTSNNCRGRDRHGRIGRVAGSGPIFGEYGGAAEVVRRAVQAVAQAWSRRGPGTRLSQALVTAAGADDVPDLLAGLIRGRYSLTPDAAPLVFAGAQAGDPVAQEIVHWAGQALGSLANGVIQQLDLMPEQFDVVLAGSLYRGSPRLIEAMAETIHAVAPAARLVRLQAPPVIGGVLWGMEVAGVDPTPCRPTLIETTAALPALAVGQAAGQ